MKFKIVLFVLCGYCYPVAGQPPANRVNDTTHYATGEYNTISSHPNERANVYSGMGVDAYFAPVIEFANLTKPHPSAEIINIDLQITGTNILGVYGVFAITEAGPIGENFLWFDGQNPGLSETYLDLIQEGSISGIGSFLQWENGIFRAYDLVSTRFIILPFQPLVNNIFTNPFLIVGWGKVGDLNGDYRRDIDDVDVVQNSFGLTGDANDYYDFDDNDVVDHEDVLDWVAWVGSKPGDANGDGLANNVDFNILALNLFTFGDWTDGDFNSDGVIDGSDFNIWNDNRDL